LVGIEVVRIHHAGGESALKSHAEYTTEGNAISKLEGSFKSGELIVESSGKGERIGKFIAEPELDE